MQRRYNSVEKFTEVRLTTYRTPYDDDSNQLPFVDLTLFRRYSTFLNKYMCN